MAEFLPNEFTAYTLTSEEDRAGSILNYAQKYKIQTARADIAAQILRLKLDPLNPVQFGLDHAYLQGQLDAYSYILNLSEETINPKMI